MRETSGCLCSERKKAKQQSKTQSKSSVQVISCDELYFLIEVHAVCSCL